ncbi:hypothetical protein ACFLQY_04360 [Verrucomicrobiota bacterium]
MIKALFRFFNPGDLLKDSSVLLIGMGCVHISNLLFQMVMGRCLPEDEYAKLISLLGMLSILTIPLGVVSSTINRYSSLLILQGHQGDVAKLVRIWSVRMLVSGLFVALIFVSFSRHIAVFLHLDERAPVWLFAAIVVGLFCRPVFDGALMGMQRFKCYSVASVLGWGTRLVAGSLLVLFVSTYSGWGLLAHGLGFYVAVLVGAVSLMLFFRKHEVSCKALPRVHTYMAGSFSVLLGFSVLMTADVVLVKHLFDQDSAVFSYAANIGRLVIFVPQAFIAAMFPKVVAERSVSRSQLQIFGKTLVATLLMTVCSAVLFMFMARLGVFILYGISEPCAALLLWSRLLAFVMVPVALLSVICRFLLAQNRFKFALVVPCAALVYVVSVLLWANGPFMTLVFLGIISVVTLLTMGVMLWLHRAEFNVEGI